IIRNLTYNSGGLCYGMYLYYNNNALQVTKNKIYLHYDGQGISINYGNVTKTAQGWVANNFITVGGSNNGSTAGLYTSYNNYHNYYYNSVLLTNTQSN